MIPRTMALNNKYKATIVYLFRVRRWIWTNWLLVILYCLLNGLDLPGYARAVLTA